MGFIVRSTTGSKVTIYYMLKKQRDGNKINVRYSTGITIPSHLWEDGRIKLNSIIPFDEYKGYKTKLRKIEDAMDELLQNADLQTLTAARIYKELDFASGKSIHKKKKVSKKSFYDFYKEELEKMRIAQEDTPEEKLKPKDPRRVAYFKYRDLKEKINASRMDWEDFDFVWHDTFVEQMRSKTYIKNLKTGEKKHYSLNYIGKLVGYVKAILRKGMRYGYNEYRYYEEFKVITEKVDLPYLNEYQLQLIYDLELPKSGALDNARDCFIMGCWLGMRVGNYNNLTEDNFNWKEGIVEFVMNKGGGRQEVPIHWTVEEIWKKHNNGLPRKISDQKLNKYIKIVAEKAGLTDSYTYTKTIGAGKPKTITERLCDMVCSHTARRSLCTNLYIRGVDPLVIMSISGHSTVKQFEKYVKAQAKDMLRAALKLEVWKKPKGKAVKMKVS